MKKVVFMMAALVMSITLAACEPVYQTGPVRPEVQTNRENYINGKNSTSPAYNVTSVIEFIDSMNESLEPSERIVDYVMSYDAETDTVYLKQGDSAIVFKVDADGKVIFASCSGDPERKTTLSQGIAKVIMYGGASPVEQLFDQIEESRWLNQINTNVVMQKLQSDFGTSMDTAMPDWTLDASGELDTTLTMPTITNELERAGLKDMADYFESPTLPKFWQGIDRDEMLSEIDTYGHRGEAFKDIVMPDNSIAAPDMTNLLSDDVKDALLRQEKGDTNTIGNGS